MNQSRNFMMSAIHLSFALLCVLVAINGLVKEYIIWAQPLAEAMVLLFFPILLFLLPKVWYSTTKNRGKISSAVVYILLAAVNFLSFLRQLLLGESLFVQGQLQNSICFLLSTVLFSAMSFVTLLRINLEKKSASIQ